MFYPICVGSDDSLRVPKMEWDENKREYKVLEKPKAGETAVWPIREQEGQPIEKRWHRGWERVASELGEYRARRNKDGEISIDFKARMDESAMPRSWWSNAKYSSANGTNTLKSVLPETEFDFPKSVELVKHCLLASGANESDVTIVDFFAGSGTTGHAVINLNREDSGQRKFILMEIGRHFDEVLLLRMKKVVYSEKWKKDGKPEDRNGISQLFKYVRLESYEDTLDSLTVNSRRDLFAEAERKEIAEDYQLRYALGEETAESASLCGKDFIDPFNYTLSVVRDGIRRDVNVDLAETFNFLLGLRLASRRQTDGVLTITGTNSKGENCMILWRNLKKMNASKLDKWFAKHRKTFGDDLDLIYVNGDHTLNALRKKGDKWEAVTTEPVFRELMFGNGRRY